MERAAPSADGVLTLYDVPFPRQIGHRLAAEDHLYETTIQSGERLDDFQVGLFPVHSPLLGESWLVSFPPLIDMLKFSG